MTTNALVSFLNKNSVNIQELSLIAKLNGLTCDSCKHFVNSHEDSGEVFICNIDGSSTSNFHFCACFKPTTDTSTVR